MARPTRPNRRRDRDQSSQRDAAAVSRRDYPIEPSSRIDARLPDLPINDRRDPVAVLSEIEDHRLWHPDRVLEPSPRTVTRLAKLSEVRPSRVKTRKTVVVHTRGRPLPSPRYGKSDPLMRTLNLEFKNPRFVIECVRRKQRRESLFASRKTGKGAKARKHYDTLSSIQCRRK